MGTLRLVTLTGAGESTSFTRMARISKNNKFVEWGVLYSPSQAGLHNRYPTLEWIAKFAEEANAKGMRISLHLCGSIVRKLLKQSPMAEYTDESQRILEIAELFGRVQLNTTLDSTEQSVRALDRLVQTIHGSERRTCVILQYHKTNAEICDRLGRSNGFECLVDESGGRGIEPEAWPLVSGDVKRIGYAGGLGPENVYAQLSLIDKAAVERTYWIDAETKLRDNKDHFDLNRCGHFLNEVQRFWEDDRVAKGAHLGKGFLPVAKLDKMWLDWWIAISRGQPCGDAA
jgi:phosphoribosylanthranilate isomerase